MTAITNQNRACRRWRSKIESRAGFDFPNRGATTLALFARLDAIVAEAGGRLYPAKDARMSGEFFRRAYPRLDAFLPLIDLGFSSDFARRVLPQAE